MKIGVEIKIDVTKLDKIKFFKGEKGTYCTMTTFIDVDIKDQYGNNGFITQSLTKEERQNNIQAPIIGNNRVFFNDSVSQPEQPAPSTHSEPQPATDILDDDVPF
ncbi:unnamed protein product [marine sediment metagenome]|uniref:Uncharacterized protein n=1 Tax=marine sediment metagenome TaxID=412755 RepID=X1SCZ8_9ZZZZ